VALTWPDARRHRSWRRPRRHVLWHRAWINHVWPQLSLSHAVSPSHRRRQPAPPSPAPPPPAAARSTAAGQRPPSPASRAPPPPPHLQINRSRPKFVTIQNSQRTTHATVIDHQTHLHTSADSLQCRSRRCSSSTSISGTTKAVIHSRPSSITSSTSCTMFKPGSLCYHEHTNLI